MPVHIAEIAKRLGCSASDVREGARLLGIQYLRGPMIDKITGEFLEMECRKLFQDGKLKKTFPSYQPQPQPNRISPSSQTTVLRPQQQTPLVTSAVPPQPRQHTHAGGQRTNSKGFEREVRKVIDQHAPYSTLSNVLLFHAERARFAADSDSQPIRSDFAFEIDHLLHRASGNTDVLLVVECKNQPVTVANEKTWQVRYFNHNNQLPGGQTHNVQHQIERHAQALRAYVNPLSRGRELQVEACVVSSDPATVSQTRRVNAWLTLHLMNVETLALALQKLDPKPLRVVQSDLLGLLRLAIPIRELGHPEMANAVAYIERCRRSLDAELFRAFDPAKERWAINGSAGMGKSVLLAYSLFVLTTDKIVREKDGNRTLESFVGTATEMGLPQLGQRGIYAFALKEKQRQVLEILFRRFVDEFSPLSHETDLSVRRPVIRLWNGKIPDDCQVLVLDEAHDLPATDAEKVAVWTNTPDTQRYLLIACDRHQKLRLVGRDETIIQGISFSLKTKKLRLNYRNPFAVYAASLGLMFRWFAKQGPKVIPSRDDLENGFGFSVETTTDGTPNVLTMRNDAHPANSWSHCISVFPSCETALARLRQNRFRKQDVLWVRFADEEDHFDYEQLSTFTYHNLNSAESVELADKYVKGQDFPIVVIEGFSSDMDEHTSPDADQRMWQRRRELYLCASRATAFLFIIPRVSHAEGNQMAEEVEEMVRQLATPTRDSDGFWRTWRFSILPTDDRRRMDVFTDAL